MMVLRLDSTDHTLLLWIGTSLNLFSSTILVIISPVFTFLTKECSPDEEYNSQSSGILILMGLVTLEEGLAKS